MVKVEVTKDGWGDFKKGTEIDMQKSTAQALVAHKVVKIVSEDPDPEPDSEKDPEPKTIKSDKDKK